MTGRRRISQLPFRTRLVVSLLYIAASGLIFAVTTVSFLHGFRFGVGIGIALETLLLMHLTRQALSFDCLRCPEGRRSSQL